MHKISLGEVEFDVFGNYAYTCATGKDDAADLASQLLGCEVDFKNHLPSTSIDGPFYMSLTINSSQHLLVVSTISDDLEIESLMINTFNEIHN